MKTLIGPDRTVYWVGSPTLKDEEMDAAVVEVNAVAQEVAKHHPKVHYVDAYKLFSGNDGKYAGDLPDETGEVITMRAGDGVHLTMDGAAYLARNVYQLVDTQCGVTEQKVDGAVKPTIESEGSTQVAPSCGFVVGRVRHQQRRRHHPDDPTRTRADRADDDDAAPARHRSAADDSCADDDHGGVRVEPVNAGARR